MNMLISVESIRNELYGHVHRDLVVDLCPFRLHGSEISVDERSTMSFDVYRTDDGWHVAGEGDITVTTECSRCLKTAELTIPVAFSVEIPSGVETESYEEDLPAEGIIPEMTEDHQLDVTDRVREEIILALPLKILCDPECPGLCPMCGIDLNEATCDCEEDVVDPRLAELKKLKESLTER